MVGAIRRWDILSHPFVTIHCFGWKVFFRALTASRDQTFLSLLAQTGAFQSPEAKIPELVERCIQLEVRAKRVYEWLAGQFLGYRSTSEFSDKLALEEENHTELLVLCREAARRSAWKEEHFAPWRGAVSRLEDQMSEVESSLDKLENMADGLRLVIQIETSEINQVFRSVVAATGAEFVRKLRPFQAAATEHISFICEEIPKWEPDLAEQCRELRDSCSAATN